MDPLEDIDKIDDTTTTPAAAAPATKTPSKKEPDGQAQTPAAQAEADHSVESGDGDASAPATQAGSQGDATDVGGGEAVSGQGADVRPGVVSVPPPQQAVTAPVSLQPDEIDKELAEAIEAVKADEMLTEGQKRAETARLKMAQEDRSYRRQQQAQQQADAGWNNLATQHKLPKDTLRNEWDAIYLKLSNQGFRGDRLQGAADYAFEQRIAQLKVRPAATPATTSSPTVAATTTTTTSTAAPAKGGTNLAPTGGRATRAPATAADEDARFIRDHGAGLAELFN